PSRQSRQLPGMLQPCTRSDRRHRMKRLRAILGVLRGWQVRRALRRGPLIVSLFLMLATAALWFRSHYRIDSIYTQRVGRAVLFSSARGCSGVISEPASSPSPTYFGSYPADAVPGGGRLRQILGEPETTNGRLVKFGSQDIRVVSRYLQTHPQATQPAATR